MADMFTYSYTNFAKIVRAHVHEDMFTYSYTNSAKKKKCSRTVSFLEWENNIRGRNKIVVQNS